MKRLRMEESDYEKLKQLEDAFEKKDLSFFKSFLHDPKEYPLLLRVHSSACSNRFC